MTIVDDKHRNRLAEIAAESLSSIIFLQQPWGEFRESIPQTLATLASRGREAQQYQFVAKPKVFASFEVIRTLNKLSTNGLKDDLKSDKDAAINGLLDYLRSSLVHGIEQDGVRWFKDFRIAQTTAHTGGLPDLIAYGDLRHTAEAIHCVLQFGKEKLSASLSRDGLTYERITSTLLKSELLVSKPRRNQPASPAQNVVRTHALNYLLWLLTEYAGWRDKTRSGSRSGILKKTVRETANALSDSLAHRAKNGLWITDGLGAIWGSSFVLHLLGPIVLNPRNNSRACKTLRPKFNEALAQISRKISAGLVDVGQKDKIVETNLQAVLALAENRRLRQSHVHTLKKLIDLMKSDSMELGESCYAIQLAITIAKNEFLERAKTALHGLCETNREVLQIKSRVASFAEQLKYAVECHAELVLREEAPPGFSEAKNVSLGRCSQIIQELNPLLKKYHYPTLTLAGGNPKRMLRSFEDMLARFGAFSPIEINYPDIAGLSAGLLVPKVGLEIGEKGRATSEEKFLIGEIWRGSREPVTYRSLVPGISGASVYLTGSTGSWPKVFKSHSSKEIQKEINRYQRFVHAKMPGAPLLFGPVSYGHTYALAYEYVLQRAPSSPEQATSDLSPKGHPLNEIVLYSIRGDLNIRDPRLEFYESALRIAWKCLGEWRQESEEINRPGLTFERSGDGWFCFPWTKEKILHDIASVSPSSARKIGLDPNVTKERVQVLLNKYSQPLPPRKPKWVHGDFHPGNIFAMFHQKTDGKRDVGKLDFDSGKIIFGGAIPIDFANVTDGQNMWLDFGKYLRDLFERVLPKCLKDVPQRQRLEFMAGLRRNSTNLKLIGNDNKGLREKFRRAKRLLAITLKVFSGTGSGRWSDIHEDGKLALLYFEVSLLCSCLDEWKPTRCGNWKNRDLAYVAMLSGVDHAARLLLSLT